MSKDKVKEHYRQDEHYEFNRLVADAFHRLERLNPLFTFNLRYCRIV
jgi:hypothetical protein